MSQEELPLRIFLVKRAGKSVAITEPLPSDEREEPLFLPEDAKVIRGERRCSLKLNPERIPSGIRELYNQGRLDLDVLERAGSYPPRIENGTRKRQEPILTRSTERMGSESEEYASKYIEIISKYALMNWVVRDLQDIYRWLTGRQFNDN